MPLLQLGREATANGSIMELDTLRVGLRFLDLSMHTKFRFTPFSSVGHGPLG